MERNQAAKDSKIVRLLWAHLTSAAEEQGRILSRCFLAAEVVSTQSKQSP
jgi:hypothetical protein